MRMLVWLGLLAGGCASSATLDRRAEWHMTQASRAAAAGDYRQARHEQRRAVRLYQQASARAYEEERPPPPPPRTPPPLPGEIH